LRRHRLLVRERLLEHRRQRLERGRRVRDRLELDRPVAREHEVEQLHAVLPFFVTLHPQPFRGAEKLLAVAEPGHRQIGVRGLKFGVDLIVDCRKHSRVHEGSCR
jgi:hypothetical protein